MKYIYFLIIGLISSASNNQVMAQWSSKYIDNNNISAPINADGYFFNGTQQVNGFEAPRGSGKIAIHSSNLWIGGLDQFNVLHIAAQTDKVLGTDYWPGPLKLNGTAYPTGNWDKIWEINRAVIDTHIANYNHQGYTLPASLIDWPGSTYNGVAQVFAPYADVNNNNVYDPSYGDYPKVDGDKALYIMYNDNTSSHGQSGGVPLGVEIYSTVYAYNVSAGEALGNTVFVRHRIRNRSQKTYHNLYVGIWNDFDIGDNTDDFIGTDVPRNMIYGYNADSLDGSGLGNSYGNTPPFVGVKILNHSLANSMYYTNTISPNVGKPTTDAQFYNLLQAKWNNGTDLSYGADGFQTGQGISKYAFSNGTDPNFTGNWTVPAQADFRMLGNVGAFDLGLNGFVTIDVAYIFARPYNNEGKTLLNNYADEVQTFYNEIINGIETKNSNKLNGLLYPNPCSNEITLLLNDQQSHENGVLQIFDITGMLVAKLEVNHQNKITINTASLPQGMYQIQMTNLIGTYNGKFVKN
jgi:hypothetical protein